jgi:CBS domain-containing protein
MRVFSVGSYCRREVWTTQSDASVRAAVGVMVKQNVGFLVVVDPGERRPVGVLTDRDVALDVLRGKLDPDALRVHELMRTPVVSIEEDAPLRSAIDAIRASGVRRLPVVDAGGELVGLITWDDLARHVAQELSGVAGAIEAQPPESPPSLEERRREHAIEWTE